MTTKPIGYYNHNHGFLYDEFDKDCYCPGGCSMEEVYTASQVVEINKELQDKLDKVSLALQDIEHGVWVSSKRGFLVDKLDGDTVGLFDLIIEALK